MIQMAKFTQYYLVSTILPGFFNAGIVLYSYYYLCEGTIKIELNAMLWAFIIMASIIFTLLIGMFIEKGLFKIIRRTQIWKRKQNTITSHQNLAKWKDNLINQISQEEELKSNHLINYTEKVMSEYYFLNNIIIGIFISGIMFLIDLPYVGISCLVFSRLLIILILLAIISLIFLVMRIWLRELYILQNTKV